MIEAITAGGIIVLGYSIYHICKECKSISIVSRFFKKKLRVFFIRNNWRKPRSSVRVITGDGRVYTTNIK